MPTAEWTIVTEKVFDTHTDAQRFITVLKIQTPRNLKNLLQYKVSEINGKFYIEYSMI